MNFVERYLAALLPARFGRPPSAAPPRNPVPPPTGTQIGPPPPVEVVVRPLPFDSPMSASIAYLGRRRVASNEALLELIEAVDAEDLKAALVGHVSVSGLTFDERALVSAIVDRVVMS